MCGVSIIVACDSHGVIGKEASFLAIEGRSKTFPLRGH